MKILYVSSEGAPYSASGGLGDVIGALPKAISEINSEVCAEVILPLYGSMKEEHRLKLKRVADISFNLSWRATGASIFKTVNSGVTYYFVENHYYFDRENAYGESDDGERFAFFCMAVIEFMLKYGNIPDIIHANDWQTALSVIYLKTKYKNNNKLSGIRTLFTIHNIEYQGKFDIKLLGDVFALEPKYRGILEYSGCINLLKGAIEVSDRVSTVSPNYAKELNYDFFAFGLAGFINSTFGKISGIINGIDRVAFSAENGSDIYYPFDKETLRRGKKNNKLRLQAELGLESNADIPLLVMITRLTDTKGIELVLRIICELLSLNLQFVVLGTGEEKYENAFSDLERSYGNFKALIKFSRSMSKKLYASADIFVMPSKSEPCGLAQMIACAYGTVPIVRNVGGLHDSIIPYGNVGANGFRFDNYNAHELLYTVKQALELYADEEKWRELSEGAFKSDFSWTSSAQKYMQLYNELL